MEVKDDEIIIELYSEVNLDNPGRALTMLSRFLIDNKDANYDDYFEKQLFHGKLFKIRQVVEEATISDGDLLKGLIEYICLPKSSTTTLQQKAMSKIKQIALDSGIIKR